MVQKTKQAGAQPPPKPASDRVGSIVEQRHQLIFDPPADSLVPQPPTAMSREVRIRYARSLANMRGESELLKDTPLLHNPGAAARTYIRLVNLSEQDSKGTRIKPFIKSLVMAVAKGRSGSGTEGILGPIHAERAATALLNMDDVYYKRTVKLLAHQPSKVHEAMVLKALAARRAFFMPSSREGSADKDDMQYAYDELLDFSLKIKSMTSAAVVRNCTLANPVNGHVSVFDPRLLQSYSLSCAIATVRNGMVDADPATALEMNLVRTRQEFEYKLMMKLSGTLELRQTASLAHALSEREFNRTEADEQLVLLAETIKNNPERITREQKNTLRKFWRKLLSVNVTGIGKTFGRFMRHIKENGKKHLLITLERLQEEAIETLNEYAGSGRHPNPRETWAADYIFERLSTMYRENINLQSSDDILTLVRTDKTALDAEPFLREENASDVQRKIPNWLQKSTLTAGERDLARRSIGKGEINYQLRKILEKLWKDIQKNNAVAAVAIESNEIVTAEQFIKTVILMRDVAERRGTPQSASLPELGFMTGGNFGVAVVVDSKRLRLRDFDDITRALRRGYDVPFVLHGGMNHACLITHVRTRNGQREFLIHDPWKSRAEWVSEQTMSEWSISDYYPPKVVQE